MFRPGPEMIVVLLLVITLIFGAKRMPEIGASLGKGLRMFKTSLMGEESRDAGNDKEPGAAEPVPEQSKTITRNDG